MAADLHLPATFKPTHETAGLPGFHAIDVFGTPGSYVTAPEDVELVWPHFIEWDAQKRVGGWTCYLVADRGKPTERWYFDTHFGSLRQRGHYHKGGVIGIVAAVPGSVWPAHIHHSKHKGAFKPSHS